MNQSLKPAYPRHTTISRRRRAVLPHLGNYLLGNLLHAITGAKRIPGAIVRRAVANGLAAEQVELAVRQVKTLENLPRILLSISQDRLNKALYWDDLGLKPRARDNFLESALWGLYAELFVSDPAQKARIFSSYTSSYASAAPHFNNPAEAVEINYLAGTLKGYLRLPGSQPEIDREGEFFRSNHPCVILFNGISSPKEELHYTENALLSSGLATLSFDYPGVQENGGQTLLSFNAEELGNSLYVFLASRPEIDPSRIALHGLSLGGRLALYVAMKYPERFRAVATLSAPYDLLTDLDLLIPALRRELAISNSTSKAAVFDLARQTPLKGQLFTIEAPVLVAGGGKDLIAMPEETRGIYEQCSSTDKKLILCPGASHNCYEMMPSLRFEIAQWIKQRL